MTLKNEKLYYVGGVVRDEILGIKSVDTDYCYEGNAINFAKDNNLEIIRENPEFGTVKVSWEDEEIDIASTRCETYPKKGHLPNVTKIGCSLIEDLKRRDFTINAMAKRTTDGKIFDLLGGMDDIKNKKLRILHKNSFIDDPTRIIRGLKFSVRFGFELDESTMILQNEYLDNVNLDMSYHRLKKELIDAFSLNKQEVYTKFINEKMYKLLGQNNCNLPVDIPIEDTVKQENLKYPYMVYLGLFDVSKLMNLFTKGEKKIIDWSMKLQNELPNNNTPKESILIHRLRSEYV